MQNQLQRVINLARKTGDRIVVFDSENPENAYAVINLEEYERIVSKTEEAKSQTEDELLRQANRDIALWRNEKEKEETTIAVPIKTMPEEKGAYQTSFVSTDMVKTVEKEDLKHDDGQGKRSWSIRKDIKEAAEEVMEEDRQYLEELPF